MLLQLTSNMNIVQESQKNNCNEIDIQTKLLQQILNLSLPKLCLDSTHVISAYINHAGAKIR